jgi:hypothetical protein
MLGVSSHVSFRRPHPGSEDVSGGVDVPIGNVPARLADVSPHGKRLSDDIFAPEAPLRCKTRRYFDDSRPSILGFEREYVDKRRPTRIGDGVGEMAVLEHVLDSEIFDGDKSVAFNVDPSRLVRVILTLAGALSLRPAQSLSGPLETAWILD